MLLFEYLFYIFELNHNSTEVDGYNNRKNQIKIKSIIGKQICRKREVNYRE